VPPYVRLSTTPADRQIIRGTLCQLLSLLSRSQLCDRNHRIRHRRPAADRGRRSPHQFAASGIDRQRLCLGCHLWRAGADSAHRAHPKEAVASGTNGALRYRQRHGGDQPEQRSLLVARVLSAFAHGVFFFVGSTIAADLVPENRRASAIAMMFMGLTVAIVTGVPLGTLIGQIFGWRATSPQLPALAHSPSSRLQTAAVEFEEGTSRRHRRPDPRARQRSAAYCLCHDGARIWRYLRRLYLPRVDPAGNLRVCGRYRQPHSGALRHRDRCWQCRRRQARRPQSSTRL